MVDSVKTWYGVVIKLKEIHYEVHTILYNVYSKCKYKAWSCGHTCVT